ncbi:hypothetical protein H0H92_002926 [Tricholoma furcatifolium]|nr:hypothetical protein H0H92_002926 [Tricholoma furcatifolium]
MWLVDENREIYQIYLRNRKNVAPSNIKITRGRMAPTKTELRGGSKKWNENHLPAGAKEHFKSEVGLMAKERTGILSPWANLSSDDLQDIVDEVYWSGTYTVEMGDAWHGLNWCNTFAGAVMEAVKRTLEDLNSFEDAAARLVAVNFWLDFCGEKDEEITPYQFKKCVEGQDKKWHTKLRDSSYYFGFRQSPLIIETFANAHFQWMQNPQAGGPADEKPIGALILSLQAQDYNMKWTDISHRWSMPFESMKKMEIVAKDLRHIKGRQTERFIHRATRYMVPMKQLTERHWKSIYSDMQDISNEKPRNQRKARGSSQMTSEADHEIFKKDFVIKSDSELSGSDDDKNVDESLSGSEHSNCDSNSGGLEASKLKP